MKPYYEQDGITIYHGDCREILPTLEKVDLVLTDQPYYGDDDYEWEIYGGNIDMEYQGPVPEGYDLEHFRKTGETIEEDID